MIPLLFLCASAFGNVTNAITPQTLPDTTVIIKFENEEGYTQLVAEKASITYTKTTSSTSSKVSIKGVECKTKIPSSKFFKVYFRTRNDVRDIQFSMFKMEIKGNKRIAASSSTFGSKIEKVPATIIQLDPIKKVYSMQITGTLKPGIYGFAFVNISQNGHFYYDKFLGKIAYCIEITE